jgi:opacity protein-like surface antigen
MTSLRVIAAAILSLLAVVHSAPASAQTTNGGIASATVSAVSIEDGASASIAGAIGYRFNAVVALGVELMFVPPLTPDVREIPIPLGALGFEGIPFAAPTITVGNEAGGHATIFTINLRLTIPTRSRRLSPYLIGGAGVGTVTDNLQYTFIYPPFILTGPAAQPVIYPPILPPRTESITRTTTDFAATFGGGVSFLTSDHWSFDVDARYIGVFGERDAQIGRYGGGITYRF